jgi:hypothetical protein
MSKDTFYFSHDYNARNDVKIKKLLSKHGLLGYGIFWAVIEELYNNTNVLPTDYDTISFDLRVEKNVLQSVINDFDLFVFDGENFGSLSVQKRLEERNEKSEKARKSVLKRWANKVNNTNVLQSKYDTNTIKERKGKEIKGNKRKVKEIKLEDIILYFSENGYTNETAEKFYNYYSIANWKDSKGNEVKNWKQKAQSVWFKPENKIVDSSKPKMVW